MIIHLVDGTYELFRHFYGLRRFTKGKDRPYGAVVGVLQTVLQMIDSVKGSASRGPSEAYLGVATDHVIESFRNRLWADYKTGAGIEPALLAQFHPLEEALAAMGVVVWPMIELEADDALASAAHLASKKRGKGVTAYFRHKLLIVSSDPHIHPCSSRVFGSNSITEKIES